MQHVLVLSIADFIIRLQSDSVVAVEEGYKPFLINSTEDPHLIINCHATLPENRFADKLPLFEARNEDQRFYSVYQDEDGLAILIYDQQTTDKIQQVACLNSDRTIWDLYYEGGELNPYALKYPFGPIMLNYLTMDHDAVMMHASCAYDGESGRMFTGFSGVGKSTMSKLWSQYGNRIINDDRLIIRKEKWGYSVHNTPMYYSDIPKMAPLSGIFLISHAPENRMKQLSGALAMSRVMAFSIQNNFDPGWVAKRLDFFSELIKTIPVYDLGFVPDLSVVHHILTHETRIPL